MSQEAVTQYNLLMGNSWSYEKLAIRRTTCGNA
jgi:hypothetical protein